MAMPFVTGNTSTLKIPIHASLDTIWELLSTSTGLSRWLAIACEGNLEQGAEFKLVWNQEPKPEDTTTHRVTVWEPRRRFGFTWPGAQLSLDVSRQGSVNVAQLTCSYRSDVSKDVQIEELIGWTVHLLTLKSVAEGGVDLRTPSRAFAWEKGYITGM